MARRNINRLIRGNGLTPRETEIVELVAKGFADQEIAKYLSITYATTRNHMKKIYKKTDIHRRAKLVAYLNQ